MDQETLINLVLVFFFLIITTLVRGLKARQKKKLTKKKQTAKPSMFSFFHKIRDQIQESLQELEKQARQQRQQQQQQQQQPETESSDPTFWDELSEDEMIQEERQMPSAQETEKKRAATRNQTRDPIQKIAPERPVQGREIKTPHSSDEVPPPTLHPYGRRPSLRQAVVWAEIIGKPVALRKNQNDAIL
jgi:FtsZ-interacting cell division protein ZipA